MKRLVGFYTHRIPQLMNQLIRLFQHNTGYTGHRGRFYQRAVFQPDGSGHLIIVKAGTHSLPGSTVFRRQLHIQKLVIGKENNLGSLGKHGQMKLFGIPVHTHVQSTYIDPSPTVITRTQVIEITDNIITQIVLQMLITCRVPCFSTGPDTVKELGTFLQIKSQTLKVIIPVGIFDNHLYLRIHFLGRFQHEVTTGLGHQLQAVVRPALHSFCLYFYVGLAAGEEEIIQNKLIKLFRRGFRNLLHHLAVFGIGIAECLETVCLVDGIGNTSSCLYTPVMKEFLCLLQSGILHNQQVPVCFQINLVHFQLL